MRKEKEAMVESNTCIRGCCSSSKIPLHLRPSSFSLLSPIARGSESVVYEGRLEGAKVAVKQPFLSTSHDLDRFHQELQLLCKLEHPALAALVAAHARPPNYMFFFRFYRGGNLAEKLHLEEWSPGVHQVLEIAILLAKSLQYLHNLGIVHRDVKPANILLDENLQPYLSDFGLAAYEEDLVNVSAKNWRSSGKPTGGFHKKNMVGTIIYMAPEILRNGVHTKKSDAYSFFITINELLTGVVPYTDLRAEAQAGTVFEMSYAEQLTAAVDCSITRPEAHTVLEMSYTEQQLTAAVVSQGLRPVLAGPDSGAPSSLLALIQRGWDGNPQNRPSFDVTVEELTSIVKDISNLEKDGRTASKPSSLRDRYSPEINNPPAYQEDINWFNQGEKSAKQSSLTCKTGLNIWLGLLSDLSPYCPTLSWGSFATCGRRETMEDTHFMQPQMCNVKDIHVFGIFDGHRGAEAAEFSAQALPGFLQSLVSIRSPSDALSEAFLKTDIAFRKELSSHRNSRRVIHKNWHPGCTAIAALIVRNKLFVANAGDCRAILCRRGHPYILSKSHVASCPKERARITEGGGLVKWQVDTWRVGAAALQVTRSIGDDDVKPAVTAEPEITETLLSIDDEYLVMASDGLWDFVSNEEVVSIIKDTVKEPGMCSKRLATEAVERGSKDNVTIIVVFLRPVSTAERIY